jgi:hypothetical protein
VETVVPPVWFTHARLGSCPAFRVTSLAMLPEGKPFVVWPCLIVRALRGTGTRGLRSYRGDDGTMFLRYELLTGSEFAVCICYYSC